ncbi:MAG: DUF4240 domain-containing protein [Mycobacteriales bacterium]
MAESYQGDLWGAAYLINGGASDDGFDYFRGWLIARTRGVQPGRGRSGCAGGGGRRPGCGGRRGGSVG